MNADSPSKAVIEAVAEAEGVHPTRLSDPIFEAVDPDALDALFQDTTGQLTFEMADYRITVDHENDVELEPVKNGH